MTASDGQYGVTGRIPVIVGSRGFGNHYLADLFQAYLLAMPVAFVCVILVRPIVMRLVAATVRARVDQGCVTSGVVHAVSACAAIVHPPR